MAARVLPRLDRPKGHAFSIEEHIRIRAWAAQHDHRAVVGLDHGVDGEEYEEAILLRFGVRQRCRFILWRDAEAVVVQPLIGRPERHASLNEALESPSLNRLPKQFGPDETRTFTVA